MLTVLCVLILLGLHVVSLCLSFITTIYYINYFFVPYLCIFLYPSSNFYGSIYYTFIDQYYCHLYELCFTQSIIMSRTLIYKFSLQFGIKGIIYFINMYSMNNYINFIKNISFRNRTSFNIGHKRLY